MAFNILNHSAVPKHEILSDDEIKEIFADVDYDVSQLPKIKVNDPVEGYILKQYNTDNNSYEPYTMIPAKEGVETSEDRL